MSKLFPYNVVITGGSRGLGYALAREFLTMGDRVLITGRSPERLDVSVVALRKETGNDNLYSISRDVADTKGLDQFMSSVTETLGTVDLWINNAGTAGYRKAPLWELDAPDMVETCATNLAGTLLMTKAAITIMRTQPSTGTYSYHICNMGFTRFGALFSRSNIPHKTSKLGVAAASRFLVKELEEGGNRSIGIHEVSPGLVNTDLLMRDTSGNTRKFLEAIAETPKAVAAKLAPKIRNIEGTRKQIRYRSIPMTGLRIIARGMFVNRKS